MPGICFKVLEWGTFLLVQWVRLHVATARSMGLIPGQGTKIPHAAQCGKKINE